MATLGYIVEQTLTRIAMDGGVDTQIYTEQRLIQAIQHKFQFLFREYWWPQFTTIQEEFTLDGVTGQVTVDLSAKIKHFVDIHSIYDEHSPTPLPRAPLVARIRDIHHRCVATVPDKTRVFQILPRNTTGTIAVTYRTMPAPFQASEDEIDMDEQLLILGAAFDLLEDDGTNPGAADKFRALYNEQIAQHRRLQFNLPSVAQQGSLVLTQWS